MKENNTKQTDWTPSTPWHHEGPCPTCGKAIANDGDEIRCVGCGAKIPKSVVD